LRAWKNKGDSPLDKLRITMRETLNSQPTPEERIGELSKTLELTKISEDVSNLTHSANRNFSILIDRLDEGYTPDSIGVGIVDGLIYGTDEIRQSLGQHINAIMFLRDNLFRAVQSADQDFSRNIDGQFLRLHWDPEELFYMVTKRIRSALSVSAESDIKVWNSITSKELHGRDGFKTCLRSTLYRPSNQRGQRHLISFDHSRIPIPNGVRAI
jgi:hypothetical protein